ncbi:MAG: hypothetical protein KAR64_05155 [Thermoplasmatales archaeon]|nr:hypothetical protein [Thermoplasmatales archaeon]
MKEGYLQTKIAELNDKCKQIDQMISIQESKMRRLRQRVGNYKELLNNLNDVQNVKDQIIGHITEENKRLIKKHIEDLSDEIHGIVDVSLDGKAQKINEALDYLNKREGEIKQQAETIVQQTKEISFLMEHNNLLMMKLVNKGVLSDQDVTEMQRRAAKKTKKE